MLYSIIFAAAIVAGAIQNIAGFGAGIILMLVLPHFFDLIVSPALNAAICTGMTVILAVHYRKSTQYKLVLLPCICFTITAVSIIWVVGDMNLHLLGVAFGVFLVALSLYFLFFQKHIKINPTPLVAIGIGLFSGALSGLFSIGSTAMALYFLAVSKDRRSYIGNLQTLLAFNNVISLITRIARGIYTVNLVIPTLAGFAGILIGQKIGVGISGKLDKDKFNRFVYLLVGISGVQTLLKQLSYFIH